MAMEGILEVPFMEVAVQRGVQVTTVRLLVVLAAVGLHMIVVAVAGLMDVFY